MSAANANAACCSGAAVSTVALLCCLSVGPVVALLSGVGLGFLLTEGILVPLLVLSVGITLWGLWLGAGIHGRKGPMVVAAVGGAGAVAGVFLSAPVAYAGIALVLTGTVWSLVAVRRTWWPPANSTEEVS